MKPESQRIAIAEACGWKHIPKMKSVNPLLVWECPDGGFSDKCPDYPNDLNAMHEAEKILKGLDAFRYTQILWKVIQPKDFANYDTEKHVCATAAQRAEAFLRTIGKWRDE